MAWTNPSDPVSGTVITVAYAVANFLTQIRWLRTLTGGADPGGTGYMVTSDSTTATSWKTGTAAILHVLGYTPVNKAGDTKTGALQHVNNVGLKGTTTGAVARDVAVLANDNNIYVGNSSTANLNLVAATLLQAIIGGNSYTVYHSGNLPAAGAYVPSGLIAAFATAAAIASGWARYTALDGRVPVGAGTTFTVTYTENTAYGASWSHTHTLGAHVHNSSAHTHTGPSHTHTGPSHTHAASALGISGNTGAPSGTNTTGGTGNTSADGSHTHNQGTLDVTGTTDADGTGATGASGTGATGSTTPADTSTPAPDLSSSTAWAIPSYAVVWAQKS